MSMITVIPPRINHLERDFALWPKKSAKIYGDAVQRSAEQYRDFTKSMPAVSKRKTGFAAKGMPHDTGNLRRSIQKNRIGLLAAGVTIGRPSKGYGFFVHEGYTTSTGKRIPARPFLQWALDLGAQRIIDRIFFRASKRLP